MRPTLDDLISLAQNAGEILRKGRGQQFEIAYKGEIDPVTEIDRLSEAYLLGEIRRRFPDHSIVAEESGAQPGKQSHTWYIDPLDGTVNYAHGIPIYSVSVAYAEDGQVRLGVVYDPNRDECFSAERGRGAWLNGKAIGVSKTGELIQSLLVTGFPYDIATTSQPNLEYYGRFALRSQGVRRLGSAALDLCYVGAGRFDGYWEMSLQPWDLAAGSLIAAEGGARVSDAYGQPDPLLHPPCSALASTPGIYEQMLTVLRGGESDSR